MDSLSLLVGTGECNANCMHCAGRIHRDKAPKEDGLHNEELYLKTLLDAYSCGARRLTISSSGEPTLSPLAVTRVLELCREHRLAFCPTSLYTNGIMIGSDAQFGEWLCRWRKLGLTTIYLTVHDQDESVNAKIYGIDEYPPIPLVCDRIKYFGFVLRANIILGRNTVATASKFANLAQYLLGIGVDTIAAWPVKDANDEEDTSAISEVELNKIGDLIRKSGMPIHLERGREAYDTGSKMTLFPDGTLSNKWCN